MLKRNKNYQVKKYLGEEFLYKHLLIKKNVIKFKSNEVWSKKLIIINANKIKIIKLRSIW